MPEISTETLQQKIQVVILSDEQFELYDKVIHGYLEHEDVEKIILINNSGKKLSYKILQDKRITVYNFSCHIGEGVGWKIAANNQNIPITLIHGTNVSTDNPKDFISKMVLPLLKEEADIVFSHSTVKKISSGQKLKDIINSSIAIKTAKLADLGLSQDGSAIRAEMLAQVGSTNPHLKIMALSVSAVNSGHKSHQRKKAIKKKRRSARWGSMRYSKIGERIADWHKETVNPNEKPDTALTGILEDLSVMKNYPRGIFDMMKDYLGSSILEVGAGHGSITSFLCENNRKVVVQDISDAAIEVLKKNFFSMSNVTVVDSMEKVKQKENYDSIVLVNVIEHVKDEELFLHDLNKMLKGDGCIIVFAPAHPELHGDFDNIVGHHRRYRLGDMAIVAQKAGLEVKELRYVNWIGAIVWFINSRMLKKAHPSKMIISIYDKVITPISNIVDRYLNKFFGQSVFCVLTKPKGHEKQ